VAGLIDEIGVVEILNQRLGIDSREKVSTGVIVKAMLLNGLGFVSAPLYLFGQFFQGKATEHLLGKGIEPDQLNDDRLGNVLDEVYTAGLSELFLEISLAAAKKFEVTRTTAHLDSTSLFRFKTTSEKDRAISAKIHPRISNTFHSRVCLCC
jgi:transposase